MTRHFAFDIYAIVRFKRRHFRKTKKRILSRRAGPPFVTLPARTNWFRTGSNRLRLDDIGSFRQFTSEHLSSRNKCVYVPSLEDSGSKSGGGIKRSESQDKVQNFDSISSWYVACFGGVYIQ